MLTRSCKAHYLKGLDFLARHRPEDAVRSLHAALEECPAAKPHELYNICFYLGIALRRIGYPQAAIKSWISCQRLIKRGRIKKMLSRYTNCYGMDRQASSEADDWQAFSAIQIARYLCCKNKHAFSSEAEQDMIIDLIRDAWHDFLRSSSLDGKSGSEKMEAFRTLHIVFPTLVFTGPHINGRIISINFRTREKVFLTDRCSCGSGLAYMMCCGRTPAKEELLTGVF
jgi:hypothetical protein